MENSECPTFNWACFELDTVLCESLETHSIVLLGSFTDRDGQAIVVMRRRGIDAEPSSALAAARSLATVEDFHNDIFCKFTGTLSAPFNAVSVDVVWPADDRQIAKYSRQSYRLFVESPEDYRRITAPYIASIPTAKVQWVYNILEKRKEADRILLDVPPTGAGLEDARAAWLLLPDMKWDQKQIEQLYCQALVYDRRILSVRDLREEHLPLLRDILTTGRQCLSQKFGVAQNQLRVYVHYQPSYYHFHVHFSHIEVPAVAGVSVGKALLLADIIDNLSTFGGDFYARKTLHYTLGAQNPLAEAWGAGR